jgi:cytochrome c biogenesis protein CcmG/thiol:disulfide interchange protein DsbE
MTDGFSNQERKAQIPRKWGSIFVWAGLLGILLLLALGLTRARQGPVGVGETVPDFILTTFDGKQIDIKDLRGKVVVINFWASWCGPCEEEAVELEQTYQNFKDQDVVFLGVDFADTETEALAYLAKFNITYPNGPDLGTRISQAFRTRGVPETYIVGRDGMLVSVKIGPYISLAEIENVVLAALGK